MGLSLVTSDRTTTSLGRRNWGTHKLWDPIKMFSLAIGERGDKKLGDPALGTYRLSD